VSHLQWRRVENAGALPPSRRAAALAAAAEELAHIVFGPVRAELPGLKRLFVVPDDALDRAPFRTLLERDPDLSRLATAEAVTVLPSASAFRDAATPP
jgi:hypothetical protein